MKVMNLAYHKTFKKSMKMPTKKAINKINWINLILHRHHTRATTNLTGANRFSTLDNIRLILCILMLIQPSHLIITLSLSLNLRWCQNRLSYKWWAMQINIPNSTLLWIQHRTKKLSIAKRYFIHSLSGEQQIPHNSKWVLRLSISRKSTTLNWIRESSISLMRKKRRMPR